MVTIQAGRLDKRVTLRRAVTSDADGDLVEAPVDVAEVWAQIEPRGSREYVQAAMTRDETTHLITMRARADLAPDGTWWIEWAGRRFEFLGPPRNVGEAGVKWEIEAKETT